MRVGWLHDNPGYIGGAEMTQAEFRAAAPDNVEVIDCPPGNVTPDLPTYVVHNHYGYSAEDLDNLSGKVVRYYNDLRPLRVEPDVAIFCSPGQQERMNVDASEQRCVPPAANYSAFKPNRQQRRNQERKGAVSIAQWRNPGKGGQYVAEWARAGDEDIDVFGPGPFKPEGLGIRYHGELDQAAVAQTLWEYERFVFLPFEFEPFCRSVAEAHFAGCDVVTNRLVGAAHYLENDPLALETAARDFWRVVLGE